MSQEKQTPKDSFMTPREAMKVLKIGRSAFYGMATRGKIPGVMKIGSQWRINSKVFWAEMDIKK